jgi:hypothetical protein
MARKTKKYHYIYKTTNLKNGKFYVGMHSTDNLNDGYLGSGTRLRRSIRRNGIENFKIEYLEFFDNRTDLTNREKELVNEELLKDPMCMNLKPGGTGGFMNEEHRIKAQTAGLKVMLKNRKNIERRNWLLKNDSDWAIYWKKSISDGLKGNTNWLGKKHKEETKQKIGETNSLKQKGESNSQFGTCWITNGTENKKVNKNDKLPKGWSLGRTIK